MRRPSLPTTVAVALAVVAAAAALAGATYSAFSSTAGSTGNTFATAATFGGGSCPSTMPSTEWMTGFEAGKSGNAGAGVFSAAVNGTSGQDGLDAAVTRSGAYSLKLAPNGAMSFRSRSHPAGKRSIVQRFAIRLPSLPAADVRELMKSTTLNSTVLRLGYKASTQRLTLSFGDSTTVDAATLVESSSPIAAGTWYVVDLRHEASNNPNAAHWRIDGTPQASTSKAVVAAEASSVLWGSNWPTAPYDDYTANFDDMLMSYDSADYPIGAGRILALKPNASGTHSNAGSVMQMDGTGTPVDATAWTRLDDVPLEGLADYVVQTGTSATAYAEIGFEDTTDTCIRAVRGYMTYDPQGLDPTKNANKNNGRMVARDGATESVVFDGNMTNTGTAGRTEAGMVAPAAGTWSQAALNGVLARIGFSADAAPNPRWTALMLEYDVPQ